MWDADSQTQGTQVDIDDRRGRQDSQASVNRNALNSTCVFVCVRVYVSVGSIAEACESIVKLCRKTTLACWGVR